MFKDVLHKAGFKATSARMALLKLMKKSKKPLSAENMISGLGKNFDQATIYRIVKKLKQSGIIKQIDLRHNHAHYELVDIDDHHHLICIKCGKIEDITGCEIEEMYKTILKKYSTFSKIKQHSLEFYGVCKKCIL